MNQAQFATRLDELFSVRQFEERDGWDFALSDSEKSDLLRYAGEEFASGFNGLLCAPDPEHCVISRVYLMVFPEHSLVEDAIAEERRRGCPGAVIVTHHPCDMETSGRGFVAIPSQQLDELREVQ